MTHDSPPLRRPHHDGEEARARILAALRANPEPFPSWRALGEAVGMAHSTARYHCMILAQQGRVTLIRGHAWTVREIDS